MPVAHWTPKHSGTGQMHFARFLNNGLIKRLMLKTIILSEEDAQEHCVFRYIHLAFSYALRVEITVAQSRLLLLLRLLRLEGDGEEDRTRSRLMLARRRFRLRLPPMPNTELDQLFRATIRTKMKWSRMSAR